MRLFTALDLPPDILLRLESLLSELRPEAAIKWSPLENLHITTKFIGEWPEASLDHLDSALQPLRFRSPLEIAVRNLGWYPSVQNPKVLFAGVDGGGDLPQLAAETEQALSGLGIPKDARAFSPHLTLARLKNPVPLLPLRAKVEALQSASIGSYRAAGFYLYRSDPGSNASIYRKIRNYSFESKS